MAVILLESCKTPPMVKYNKIKEVESPISLNLISRDSNDSISKNIGTKFKLKITDSVLVYKDGTSLYSNYKKIVLKASSNKKYSVSVYSFCDCFGFRKYMFTPKIRVLDKHGNFVKTILFWNEIDYLYFAKPISYNRNWIIDQEVDGDLTLIIYSDNIALNRKVENLLLSSIKSTTVGKFMLTVHEIDLN